MPALFETPLYPYRRSPDENAPLPVRHPVAVIGAGPIGLAAAIDLAMKDVPVVVLDDNDRVSVGSRAICFAKRSLEILDRRGVGEALVGKGVTWNRGKVFFGERQVYQFDLLPEDGHRRFAGPRHRFQWQAVPALRNRPRVARALRRSPHRVR